MNTLAPWQQRIYTQAADALDAGRLPHGLLLKKFFRLLLQRLTMEHLAATGLDKMAQVIL